MLWKPQIALCLDSLQNRDRSGAVYPLCCLLTSVKYIYLLYGKAWILIREMCFNIVTCLLWHMLVYVVLIVGLLAWQNCITGQSAFSTFLSFWLSASVCIYYSSYTHWMRMTVARDRWTHQRWAELWRTWATTYHKLVSMVGFELWWWKLDPS